MGKNVLNILINLSEMDYTPPPQVVSYWRWPKGRNRYNNKHFYVGSAHYLPFISSWRTFNQRKENNFLNIFLIYWMIIFNYNFKSIFMKNCIATGKSYFLKFKTYGWGGFFVDASLYYFIIYIFYMFYIIYLFMYKYIWGIK